MQLQNSGEVGKEFCSQVHTERMTSEGEARAWDAGTGREQRRASSIFPLNCRRGSKQGAGGDSLAGLGWGARPVAGLGVSM
jgi:hypothetical protein